MFAKRLVGRSVVWGCRVAKNLMSLEQDVDGQSRTSQCCNWCTSLCILDDLTAQRVALGWGRQQVDLRLVLFTVFTPPDVALKCLPGEIMPHCSAEHLQSSKTTNWKDTCANAVNLSPLSDSFGHASTFK